jgi:hypothetical protein
MPIELSLLHEPINRFILAEADDPVGAAVRRLNLAQGEDWWHLVVVMGGGRFAAIPFKSLVSLAATEQELFFTHRLGDLMSQLHVPEAQVVERDSMGTQTARELADESPGRVLVVTEAGQFLGIIYRGVAAGSSQETTMLSLFHRYAHTGMLHPEPAPGPLPAPAPPSPLPPPPPAPRYVQCEVSDNTDPQHPGKLERSFLAGREHLLTVWVAELQAGAIAAPGPVDLSHLPDLPSWDLQVYFWEPNHAPDVQVGKLTLYREPPPGQPVDTCAFTFTPHAGLPAFQGRLALVYQQNVLQMLYLEGKVVADPAETGPDDQIRFQWADVKGLGNPDQLQAFDLVFYNEADPLQGAGLMFFGGQAGLKQVSGLEAGIRDLITTLKEAGMPGGTSLEDRQQALLYLANQGSLLYTTIQEQIGTESETSLRLREVKRIQLVSAVRDVFPLELVYVYPPPEPGAVLCPNARQAIQSGTCPVCDSLDEASAAGTLCPLGFLGLRSTIERHAIQPVQKTDLALQGMDYQLRVGLTAGDKTLNPLVSSLCAVSANVTGANRDKFTTALQTLFPQGFEVAQDWNEWKHKVQATSPSILILLPHTLKDHGIPSLEIGSLPLWNSMIKEAYVRKSRESRPVVLLIGCETAVPEMPYQGFAAAFSQAGAVITVMTLSPIHESRATPITEILVRQLQQSAQMKHTFSQALLQARRTAMAAGYAEVLSLVADGDADWILTEEN